MTNGMIAWLAVDGDGQAHIFTCSPEWVERARWWYGKNEENIPWTGPIPEELRNCERACMKVVLVIDATCGGNSMEAGQRPD